MATADFTIKQGDTAPSLTHVLADASGNPVDLSGVASVHVHILTSDLGTVVADRACVVDQAGVAPNIVNQGQIHYAWQAADTANAGAFYYEFEVTFADGTIETFPNWKNLLLTVQPALVAP